MTMPSVLGQVFRGLGRALIARPLFFAAVAMLALGLQALVPPVVLSLARKPVDHVMVNPWLVRLPAYLVADVPLGEKISKLWNLALVWCSSSNPYGVEWGFAVDVGDLVRMVLTALLVAAYFALSSIRRRAPQRRETSAHLEVRTPGAPGAVSPGTLGVLSAGAPGGRLGALGGVASILGLSTGPCSVMGCGAPVLPVVALAFAGLSSTMLAWLARVSTWATVAVLVVLVVGVGWLAWRAGDPAGVPGRTRS